MVSEATMPSAVGIAAIAISPERPVFERVDFLPHRAGIADDAPRPVERPLALRRKALEPRAALHQHDAEDFLELLEAGRHRRLGDAAGLRGAPEMPFLGQRQQQFKLVDQKQPFLNDFPATNNTRPRSTNTPKAASKTRVPIIAFIRFSYRSISTFAIDRVSVSQHETALLIFGSIPILIGSVISL